MKRISFIFALALAFSFTLVAQNAPKMTFVDTTVDYGTIEQNADPFRVFTFTNTGNAPLVITNAKGSCGCTVPTYPKEPIAPGATSEIKVRYDTSRVGPFTKRITINTNEGEEPVVLTIKGKVDAAPEAPAGVPAKEGGMFNGGK